MPAYQSVEFPATTIMPATVLPGQLARIVMSGHSKLGLGTCPRDVTARLDLMNYTLCFKLNQATVERFAMVTAALLSYRDIALAAVTVGPRGINLGVVGWQDDGRFGQPVQLWWDKQTGEGYYRRVECVGCPDTSFEDIRLDSDYDLPNLPAWLVKVHPAVALCAAVYEKCVQPNQSEGI